MWQTPRTWVAAETLTAALMNAHVRDQLLAAFPVGSLHWRMQSETSVETLVDGFGLEANGVAVSRTTYADLQTKLSGLSYPFGSGNGSTTMHLPDLRGRAAWMCGSHAAADLGDSDGVTESSRQPKHTHTDSLSGSTGSAGAHTHGYARRTTGSAASSGSTDSVPWGAEGSGTTDSAGAHTHSVSLSGSVGSGMNASDAVAHLFVGVMVVKT